MIKGLRNLMKQRAKQEAEVIVAESVLQSQEVADLFLTESGEATISSVYEAADDEDVDISDADLDAIIDKIPESESDDDELLDKVLTSDEDITAEDILQASEEECEATGLN